MRLSTDDVRRLQEWGLHTQSAPRVEDADLLRRLRVEHQRLEVGLGYAETMVTPGLAKQWLTHVMPLSHLSQHMIDTYANLMLKGEFKVHPGSPIQFDMSGRVVDGQHRLHACIQADRAFNTAVLHLDDHAAWAQVGQRIDAIAQQTTERIGTLTDRQDIEQELRRALYRALSEHAMEHAR